MSNLKNPKWWEAAGTRAIKTMAQAALSIIGSSLLITEIDWRIVASASLGAAAISMIMSLAGLPEVEE